MHSQLLHLSIEKYDPANPKPIDSPRSLKAMELLIIKPDQLVYKNKQVFKSTAINGKDLDKLLQKDKRGVDCLVSQVKHKRKEIIKKDKEHESMMEKHKKEQEIMTRKLQIQSERAEKIKHEIESKNAQEIEKKFEERYRKMKAGYEESPHYDQYNNLTYVPKPKEYFKLNAMSQSIKQRFDLSKKKMDLIKTKQLNEMGHMIDYEINLQHIKKRNDEMQRQKVKTLKSMENFKRHRFEKNLGVLEEQEKKIKMQKQMDDMIKMENKKRLMMMNERELNLKIQKAIEHEQRANFMKRSEKDYEQNRKYMIKQLISDFKELKNNQISSDEISQKYSYLRDEETFEKFMADLNRRRHMSKFE